MNRNLEQLLRWPPEMVPRPAAGPARPRAGLGMKLAEPRTEARSLGRTLSPSLRFHTKEVLRLRANL